MAEKEKKWLKLDNAAEVYDIAPRTLADMCRRGKVAATKIGRRWFVSPKDMDRLAREGMNG